MPRLKLRGLMGMARPTEDLAEQRAQFAILRRAFEEITKDGFALDTLSMGMSGDLEAAIAEGATMVRVGTAVFGERDAAAATRDGGIERGTRLLEGNGS
jgi:hypothetical protein